MTIKNPNGFKKEHEQDVTHQGMPGINTDIVINLKLEDGTILTNRIPVHSLTQVSSYSNFAIRKSLACTSKGTICPMSYIQEVMKLVNSIVHFYKSLNISLDAEVLYVEGVDHDIQSGPVESDK